MSYQTIYEITNSYPECLRQIYCENFCDITAFPSAGVMIFIPLMFGLIVAAVWGWVFPLISSRKINSFESLCGFTLGALIGVVAAGILLGFPHWDLASRYLKRSSDIVIIEGTIKNVRSDSYKCRYTLFDCGKWHGISIASIGAGFHDVDSPYLKNGTKIRMWAQLRNDQVWNVPRFDVESKATKISAK